MTMDSCCETFEKATKRGTDNEGYGALIYGPSLIGCDLPPMDYCPWCGKRRPAAELIASHGPVTIIDVLPDGRLMQTDMEDDGNA